MLFLVQGKSSILLHYSGSEAWNVATPFLATVNGSGT